MTDCNFHAFEFGVELFGSVCEGTVILGNGVKDYFPIGAELGEAWPS